MSAPQSRSRLQAVDRAAIEWSVAELDRIAMLGEDTRMGGAVRGDLIDVAMRLRTVLIWSKEKAA